MCFTEQECQLTRALVDDPHHLDQNPGYKIKDKGAASCDLTSEECEEARFALDLNATAVVNTASASLPTGCYRQQEDEYRDQHAESSYKWFFNTVAGQPDSNSEPVCKGKKYVGFRVGSFHYVDEIRFRFGFHAISSTKQRRIC